MWVPKLETGFSKPEALVRALKRAIESGEIVRGALGGDPPRPAESLQTISITSRLVAAQSLDDNLVGELTKDILGLRLTLASELPAVQALETPSTDKDAPLPVPQPRHVEVLVAVTHRPRPYGPPARCRPGGASGPRAQASRRSGGMPGVLSRS